MLDFGMLIPLLQASPWALFIGRFHPVLVHLPIGFLLIAALLEIGRRSGKINISEIDSCFYTFLVGGQCDIRVYSGLFALARRRV
jgi:hypothetical protein